jgi:RIP metalloprotease RseP
MLSILFAAGMGGLMGLLPELSGPISTLQAIAILAGIVAFHELGHFTAARVQGIHVSKFAIGFGPSLWRTKRGDVEYSIRAFPLGGFVAFPDNDEDCPYPEDDPDLLKNRPILDRFWVISAGLHKLSSFL